MNTKIILKCLLLAGVVAVFSTSCKKNSDDETITDTDVSTAVNTAQAEQSFFEAAHLADLGSTGALTAPYTGPAGALGAYYVKCDTILTPTIHGTITIKIGGNSDSSQNRTCADNRWRRGIIHVAYTGGYYNDINSVRTITFDKFYVMDNKIDGTITVTNNALNTAGHSNVTVQVTNGSITMASGYGGGTIIWNSTHNREMIANPSTSTINDDIYLITGSASGTSSSGTAFTSQINTPLRREIAWKNIVSGVLSVTPSGKSARSIDFGSGTQDASAVV